MRMEGGRERGSEGEKEGGKNIFPYSLTHTDNESVLIFLYLCFQIT
jgi:hypothetical protein